MVELVHLDVCGPMRTPLLRRTRYFFTFTKDFLRKVWICINKAKSDCFDKFKERKALIENLCKYKIKVLRLYDGREYL